MGQKDERQKIQKWEIVFWVILFALILWELWTESKRQGCYEGTAECGEEFKWEPEDGDTPKELLQRLDNMTDSQISIMQRRVAMISAFVLTIVGFWFFEKQVLPPVPKFVIVFLIVMAVIWFVLRYHESHFLFPFSRQSKKTINELRYQLNIAERPQDL